MSSDTFLFVQTYSSEKRPQKMVIKYNEKEQTFSLGHQLFKVSLGLQFMRKVSEQFRRSVNTLCRKNKTFWTSTRLSKFSSSIYEKSFWTVLAIVKHVLLPNITISLQSSNKCNDSWSVQFLPSQRLFSIFCFRFQVLKNLYQFKKSLQRTKFFK